MTAASQSDEESQKNLKENLDATNISVVIDLLFLLSTYLMLFVATGELHLAQKQLLDHPHIGDASDFVR
jgi:hypothetical protein